MNINWFHHGLIYTPDNKSIWPTHGVLPFLYDFNGQSLLFFASRTTDNVASSFISSFDYQQKICYRTSDSPILSPGKIGFFDQHGAIASSIIEVNDCHYLYYIGWTRGHVEPLFYACIGLAISNDGCKTFEKYGNVPLIPRDSRNPLLMTSPCVFKDDNIYRMVYISGLKWVLEKGKLQSHYRICSAVSNDGFYWTDTGRVLINCSNKYTNYARPWVIKINDIYVMFYSFSSKNSPYQIGASISRDFISWLDVTSLLDITKSGLPFDSTMMCYPSVDIFNGQVRIFYNGNYFGRDGFALLSCPYDEFKELVLSILI